MENIAKNAEALQARVAAACAAASRKPDGVSVIAAAKTFSANAVAAAVAAGLCHVGENYVQRGGGKKSRFGRFIRAVAFFGAVTRQQGGGGGASF